jgi:hypothetical protein
MHENQLQTQLIYMMPAFNDLYTLQNAWGDLKEIEVGKYAGKREYWQLHIDIEIRCKCPQSLLCDC